MGSSPSTSKNSQKTTEDDIRITSDSNIPVVGLSKSIETTSMTSSSIVMDPDDEEHDDLIEKAKICMNNIRTEHSKKTPKGIVSSEFRRSALELNEILSRITIRDDKESLLQSFTRYNIEYKTIIIFCKVWTEIWETGNNDQNSEIDQEWKTCIILYLCNSSDDNSKICGVISEQTYFLQCTTAKLKDWSGCHVNKTTEQPSSEDFETIIGVLHNVAMFEDYVYKVRSVDSIDALKPYLDSKNKTIRVLSLGTLANIVDESESEILKSNDDVIKFLMRTISMALGDSDRAWGGFSLKELAKIVRQIARNDNNKRTVVQHGAVPLLIQLAESDDIKEQTEAVAAIWTLSFDPQNREEMLSNKEWDVIATLERISQSTDVELRKLSKNALWTIKDQATATNGKHVQKKTNDNGDSHVMISYNWGHQPMVKQIRDNLRNCGIKVWMDVDDMKGSTLQAMASAVEKADIVLLCYSFKYKNSDNCRSEAEYAYQLKKKIIPVKMEQNYKADGWLGFIIGAKLFYDFSGKYPFATKAQELTREIHETLKRSKGIMASVPDMPIVAQIEPTLQTAIPVASSIHQEQLETSTLDLLERWKPAEVEKWLDNNSLPKKLLGRLRGKDVALLRLLIQESPNTFYKIIIDHLGIKDLQTITDLRFAIHRIDLGVQTSSTL